MKFKPVQSIVQIHMVFGGRVVHNAILLSIEGEQFLKNAGSSLSGGSFTPGERSSTILVAPDIFEIEQLAKPFLRDLSFPNIAKSNRLEFSKMSKMKSIVSAG